MLFRSAFSEKELAKYYQLSREYLRRCGVGGKEPAPPPDIPPAAPEGQGGPAAPEVHIYPTGAARQKAAARRKAGGAEPAENPRQSAKPARSPASGKGAGAAARRPAGKGKAGARGSRKREPAGSRAALIAAAAALLIGLAVRAAGMGLLPFL